MPNITSVLIIEDHKETREWIASAVKEALIPTELFQAATCEQAQNIFTNQSIDLAIIDINLPDGSGIDLLKLIKHRQTQVYCVMATIYNDDEHIMLSLQAGAEGYLLKDQSKEQIIDNLRGILKDEPPISPVIAKKILRFFKQPLYEEEHEDTKLSDREQEVLLLIAKSYQRKEIASMLSISPNTVACHIKRIYSKLGINSRTEAVMHASKRGLINI